MSDFVYFFLLKTEHTSRRNNNAHPSYLKHFSEQRNKKRFYIANGNLSSQCLNSLVKKIEKFQNERDEM